MSKKDLFGDEVEAQKTDFASLFESSISGATRKLKKGDEFRGEIISFDKENVFISTGTPTDGVLPKVELLNEQKEFVFKKGDFVDVVVVRITYEEIFLRYKSAKTSGQELDSLEDNFDMEIPVEGKVIELVKGGFRVQVQNKLAFCPISQMDFRAMDNQENYIGHKFEFLITQYDKNGRNIVVSRRKVLDLQKAENEGAFLQKYHPGDIVNAKVMRFERFGAFVEIEPGIEGLVHISEIAWNHVQNPGDLLTIGQTVQAKILKIDDGDRMKISLSIKEGGSVVDPWSEIDLNFPVGKKVQGMIDKKEVYGYFVVLANGINGLLPRSKWRDSADATQFENKKKGDSILVQIDQVNKEDRKISLGLPSEDYDDSWKSHSGANSSAKKGLGTFGDLLSKAQGKVK